MSGKREAVLVDPVKQSAGKRARARGNVGAQAAVRLEPARRCLGGEKRVPEDGRVSVKAASSLPVSGQVRGVRDPG